MSFQRMALLGVVLAFVLAIAPANLHSQTATTGSVTGTVQDPSKAVVPNAPVTLTSKTTGAVLTTTTNNAGIYLFSAVPPGEYTLRCAAKGFAATELPNVVVQITKTSTYDLTLQVGAPTTTVEVTAAPQAELQTTNASIGQVFTREAVQNLPAQERSITALILLQPGASPASPIQKDDTNGGMINGATSDQTTFYVDGGDATSDLEGTNNYVSPPGEPQPAPFIAVPAEWTQEFRVVTASPTADFARSQGGEVSVLTKSGTNAFHGSAYEYYYGSATSANEWVLNRVGRHRPHQVDNRFGGNAGGYILKDKLFFFGGYEQRDLYQAISITQLVPTMSAREGILQFKDSGGATRSYNLNLANGPISTACGPAGGEICDPRALGASPLVLKYLSLLPVGNNPAAGDGLNSIGYTASYAEPILEKLAVARLDWTISPRWSMFGTFHFNKYSLPTTKQFDIGCPASTPNCASGANTLESKTPVQPRFVTVQISGLIGSNFTSQTHASYLHDWWNWSVAPLVPQLPGTDGTINIGGEARIGGTGGTSKVWGDPINYDTQNARGRIWGGKDWFIAQDSSWLHGKHQMSFGGGYYLWNLFHLRTDDVVGGLTTGPIYYVGETIRNGGSNLNIINTAAVPETPPLCAPGAITTFCLVSSTQAHRYQNMYASLLGLVDRSAQIGVRNGNFAGSPLGTPLKDQVRTHSFDTYWQDTWKIKPSLTFTYGLNWGVQFAPHEMNGKQVVEVFGNTNTPLENISAYFAQRNAALSKGQFYASGSYVCTPPASPCLSTTPGAVLVDNTFGFSPINHIPSLNGSSSLTRWNAFGPRVAVAWNPPWHNWLVGNKQTVVRVGYSIQWNRTTAVGEVLTPLLGDGLASVNSCSGPTFNGTNTATCSSSNINATNGFRLGVDGSNIPVPPTENAPIPLIPPAPFGAKSGTQDPAIHLPYSHVITLDVQRVFAHNWLLDIGGIGRFSKNLWQNQDINATDFKAATPACTANGTTCQITTAGQTLAQAYNAINAQIAAGTPATAVTPQPFFENAPFGARGNTVNAAVADGGDPSLYTFMGFNYDFIAPLPLDNLQFQNGGSDNITVSDGYANYGAMFITVHKSFSQGLDLTANYTWSHSLGTGGGGLGLFLNQQYTAYASPTPFDLRSGYGSNNGDRRQVFNLSSYYLLPFGKGRRWASGNAFFDRVIGGWYVSGIYTYATGLPACVGADGDFGSPDGGTCAVGASQFGQVGPYHITRGASCTVGCTGNINLFKNPAAVFNAYTFPLPGVNIQAAPETFNLPNSWNIDLALGKNILATERYRIIFNAQFINAFNHPILGADFNATTDLASPSNFGVISGACNCATPIGARQIVLGLRFEF